MSISDLREFERNGDYKTARRQQEMDRRKAWMSSELGVERERLEILIKRFAPSWERNLPSWVAFLTAPDGMIGMSEEEARTVLSKRTDLLSCKIDVAQANVAWMSTRGPEQDGELTGWARDFIMKLARRAPMFLASHPIKLQETLDWYFGPEYCPVELAAELRPQIAQKIRSNPNVLVASLHGRLRPRHAFAQSVPPILCPSPLCSQEHRDQPCGLWAQAVRRAADAGGAHDAEGRDPLRKDRLRRRRVRPATPAPFLSPLLAQKHRAPTRTNF